jgi:hypothetical protein
MVKNSIAAETCFGKHVAKSQCCYVLYCAAICLIAGNSNKFNKSQDAFNSF